jgi:hypothetical protein
MVIAPLIVLNVMIMILVLSTVAVVENASMNQFNVMITTAALLTIASMVNVNFMKTLIVMMKVNVPTIIVIQLLENVLMNLFVKAQTLVR